MARGVTCDLRPGSLLSPSLWLGSLAISRLIESTGGGSLLFPCFSDPHSSSRAQDQQTCLALSELWVWSWALGPALQFHLHTFLTLGSQESETAVGLLQMGPFHLLPPWDLEKAQKGNNDVYRIGKSGGSESWSTWSAHWSSGTWWMLKGTQALQRKEN